MSRKQVEEALRESERILNETGKMAKVGGWEFDVDTLQQTWTEEVYRIHEVDFSLNPDVEKGINFYHPESRPHIEKAVQRAIDYGEPFDMELRFITAKGNHRWVRAKGEAIQKQGKTLKVFGTFQDITQRRQADQALQESEQRYRVLFEGSTHGILMTDSGTERFVDANLSICRMLGYSKAELLQLGIADIHPKESLDHLMPDIKSQERGEPQISRSIPCLRKDGTVFYADIFGANTIVHGRRCNVGFFMDITERKRMEEELLRARKLESVGTLAGGIAHDFNNILTTILGNVTLARMQVPPDGELFEMLSEAETASLRARTLTRQLLTFAKGGAPVKETASIKDILKESPSFALRGSKSRCELSIPKDLWPAEVDVGQTSQVINNIVINANQAMPEGGIIQIAAENLIIEDRHGLPVKPGRYIKISITDQGVGIAEKHLSKVFDPYFTTKHEGSGLGLATTYSIVKKHGGHITVESQPGVGTTFHIYLPASDKAVSEKEEVKLITGKGRILLMDDEASLRNTAGRMLKNLGYESEFAKDGAEAIQLYKAAKKSEKPYDAVILDLTIPGGMGGKDAVKKLLEIDPEVKAIVFSGYSDDPVLSNFQEYGFKGMMPKPFESRSLGKVLHEVLKGEKK